jgi:hypothetical protein
VVTKSVQPVSAVPPGHVRLEFRSFEILALEQAPLTFAPPYLHCASNAAAFHYQWSLLAFAFPFRDPTRFPAVGRSAFGTDADRLDRYIAEARELAGTSLLNGNQKMTVSVAHDGADEEISADFEAKELTRGFAVSFRQFSEADERASFNAAFKAVCRVVRPIWGDNDDWTQLQIWRFALGKLRAKPLKVLVGDKLAEQRLWPEPIPGDGPPYPQQIIKMYNYGDLIHWGNDSAAYGALGQTEFDTSSNHLRFLDAVVGPAHLFLGFATVIEAILTEPV